jgi:hypothetical protein
MERSNLGSSCWWRHDPTGGEAVKEPTCDVGGGRLMASFTDPDGNVLGLFTRGSGDQSLIDSFSARRGTEHRRRSSNNSTIRRFAAMTASIRAVSRSR